MRQNRSGYVNNYRIYKLRQSIRPPCIITGAVTKLPKKVIPEKIPASGGGKSHDRFVKYGIYRVVM